MKNIDAKKLRSMGLKLMKIGFILDHENAEDGDLYFLSIINVEGEDGNCKISINCSYDHVEDSFELIESSCSKEGYKVLENKETEILVFELCKCLMVSLTGVIESALLQDTVSINQLYKLKGEC